MLNDAAEFLAQAGDIAMRRMQDDPHDDALMAKWLTDPRVLEFYEGRDNPFPLDRVQEYYNPQVLEEEGVVPCLLIYQGTPIGYLQYYPLSAADRRAYGLDDTRRSYGMDMFIGEPELWNRGIGTRALAVLVGYLFRDLQAEQVTVDPHVDNLRAIRAYEKSGFRRVKVLPRHELHEGVYRDCWLMVRDRSS